MNISGTKYQLFHEDARVCVRDVVTDEEWKFYHNGQRLLCDKANWLDLPPAVHKAVCRAVAKFPAMKGAE